MFKYTIHNKIDSFNFFDFSICLYRMNYDLETIDESLYEDDIQSLEHEIQTLKQTADLLLHRLDSMQRSLEQDSFQLATRVVQLKETDTKQQVTILLEALSLDKSSLTLGSFLKAFNVYILKQNLVDLNDLHIHFNPLLQAVFQSNYEKVPYGFFLKSLPDLFI